MFERLANHPFYCFLDGYSGFFQIPIHPNDHEKTTFTCPYDLIEEMVEVFMDDFSVYGASFSSCLSNLCRVLQRCEETNLVDVMLQLPVPKTVKDIMSFLGHARTLLKDALVSAPIVQVPNWDHQFEIMCDASDYAVGAVLGQKIDKKLNVIYYASRTMDDAQCKYATTEKELLAVVFSFEKF
ncbi:unnamed protein product [Microthlaspi erraticum]|uniref:Reverse transcriptase/retrotransposon-derived protein RNase H-like domain-containing protein n=1 Tax=Microthlaspi erraticum TaxID=1685480 RepID=A0A6D2IG54_9BRAS|nr:unnamed protein product [Microthlaspi erraticum]